MNEDRQVTAEAISRAAGLRRAPSVTHAASTSASAWPWYGVALIACDLAAILLGSALAEALNFGELWTTAGAGPKQFSYATVVLLMAPAWVLAIAAKGGYERAQVGTGTEEYRRVFDAAIRYLAVVAACAFALNYDVARGFVAIAIPVATLLALIFRYASRRWLHAQRAQGRFVQHALVVGSDRAGTRVVIEHLARTPHAGIRVVDVFTPGVNGHGDATTPAAILASAQAMSADVVVVTDSGAVAGGSLRDLAWQLEASGIGLMAAPDAADPSGLRVSVRPVADLPFLLVEKPEIRGWRRLTKAAVDRLGAALALIGLSPLFLAIAVAIRVTAGGPVFFRQTRVGIGGREFAMWKFRTMVVDAEQRLDEVQHRNEHDGVLFKIQDDPRVTPIGRILRRWSLDELPQLWNVLTGDMSLVGPRPPLPSEVERYSPLARRRLLVKPGMTGLWQVSGRSRLSWDETLRLDLHYVQNWSPTLDTMILARTVIAVIRGHGAY